MDFKKISKDKGFTLIELLVVIGIVGVLTSLVAFNFQQARQRARDTQRKFELKQLQNALELYKNDQNPQAFPENLSSLVSTYIKELPRDPIEKSSPGSWEDYQYLRTSSLEYILKACLENAGDPHLPANPDGCASDKGKYYLLTQP